MQMITGRLNERSEGTPERREAAKDGRLLRVRCGLFAVVIVVAGGSLPAAEFAGEDPLAVRDSIGDGIHAFHAGDYDRAYDALTNAIEAGTEDARCYYFRGLAALRLGRTHEAEADFVTGADRELSSGSIRRVSQSLERVQGHDRLSLERFRSRARLGALQRDREAYGRRYSAIEDASGDVRRRRRPEDIRPELIAPRGGPSSDLPAGRDAIEEVPAPVSEPAEPAEPAKPAKPGTSFEDEPAAESDDPFSDEPASGKQISEDEAAEKDVQDEEMAAEAEDTAAERDVQNEVEAAAGQ
jgi:hypothetical protein